MRLRRGPRGDEDGCTHYSTGVSYVDCNQGCDDKEQRASLDVPNRKDSQGQVTGVTEPTGMTGTQARTCARLPRTSVPSALAFPCLKGWRSRHTLTRLFHQVSCQLAAQCHCHLPHAASSLCVSMCRITWAHLNFSKTVVHQGKRLQNAHTARGNPPMAGESEVFLNSSGVYLVVVCTLDFSVRKAPVKKRPLVPSVRIRGLSGKCPPLTAHPGSLHALPRQLGHFHKPMNVAPDGSQTSATSENTTDRLTHNEKLPRKNTRAPAGVKGPSGCPAKDVDRTRH